MENTNTVVGTSAPEAAPVKEPAPAPQADVVVKAEAPSNEVKIGDLLAEKKVEAPKAGSDKPAAAKEPEKPAPPAKADPAKDGKKPDANPPVMKSQEEINYGIGKRIEAERKKWERENAALLQIARIVQEANPGLTPEQVIAKIAEDRNTTLGLNAEVAALLTKKGVLGGAPAAREAEAPASEEELDMAASRLVAEEKTIQEKYAKDFDAGKFIAEHPEHLSALRRGEVTLTELYQRENFDVLLRKAREDGVAEGQRTATSNIRERNDHIPDPPSPSAPATHTVDFSKMSDKEFKEANATIDQALREGKRVTF